MNEIMIKLQGKCQEKFRESKDHIRSWGLGEVFTKELGYFKIFVFSQKRVNRFSAVNSNITFLMLGTLKWDVY